MQRKPKQLPQSFAQDFKPERRLLAQLLAFVSSNGRGDKHQISAATGIPTGAQTGKVEPMIHYATGMGLIESHKSSDEWQLHLTPLGNVVFGEDPYLSEEVSLWLMHLMLCRPYDAAACNSTCNGVADPWFALFSLGEMRLGTHFSPTDYQAFLTERLGEKSYLKGMVSLILRSYEEESCLGLTRALAVQGDGGTKTYSRTRAPQSVEFYPAYTTYMLQLWDEFFHEVEQLTLKEFFRCTRMLAVMNWTRNDSMPWLEWMADHGILQLDRQTGETLAHRTVDTADVLNSIYSELV